MCSSDVMNYRSSRSAEVAELADARDSKSRPGNRVWVQFPPSAFCFFYTELTQIDRIYTARCFFRWLCTRRYPADNPAFVGIIPEPLPVFDDFDDFVSVVGILPSIPE